MRATEFFNLFPEEIELINKHFKQKKSFEKLSGQTGQQVDILRRTEATLIVKICTGFRHCGVMISCANLRKALSDGTIEIKEELK